MTKRMERDAIYRGRRYSAETIELRVRWYISYRLSYRDLAAMMAERDVLSSPTRQSCVGCCGTCRNTSADGLDLLDLLVRLGVWTKQQSMSAAAVITCFGGLTRRESLSGHCSAVIAIRSLRKLFSAQLWP